MIAVRARVERYNAYLLEQRASEIREMERFAVALGARPLVIHRDPADLLRNAANDDVYNAVLWALQGTD